MQLPTLYCPAIGNRLKYGYRYLLLHSLLAIDLARRYRCTCLCGIFELQLIDHVRTKVGWPGRRGRTYVTALQLYTFTRT